MTAHIKFKKTFWMNVLAAIGWFVIAIFIIMDHIAEHGFEHYFLLGVFQYICIVASPIASAFSVYFWSNIILKRLALFANYTALTCCVLFTGFLLYKMVNISDLLVIPIIFLLFGLPAFINLKALKVRVR